MSGTVFANTLRTSWKQVLYWGLGLGVLGFYIDFIASSSDIIQGYADLFASMPPAMLQAFGASSVELLRTSEGWIVSIFVSEAAIFLSVFAVMAGMNISANDEQFRHYGRRHVASNFARRLHSRTLDRLRGDRLGHPGCLPGNHTVWLGRLRCRRADGP